MLRKIGFSIASLAPLALIGATMAQSATPASDIAGTYRGSFDGAEGTIVITGAPPKLHLKADMGANRCTGSLEGPASLDAKGAIVLSVRPAPGEKICRLTMKRSPTGWDVEEDNCSFYHGASCAFSGTAVRRGVSTASTRASAPESKSPAPSLSATPTWNLTHVPSGAALAKVEGLGQVSSMALVCLNGLPTMMVKLEPSPRAAQAVLAAQAASDRQQVTLGRIKDTDGWGAVNLPAGMIALMASNAGPTLSLDGHAVGKLPGANAREVIGQALAPCTARSR